MDKITTKSEKVEALQTSVQLLKNVRDTYKESDGRYREMTAIIDIVSGQIQDVLREPSVNGWE